MVAALWVPAVSDGLELEVELLEVELELGEELELELGLWPAVPPHPDAAMTTAASRTDVGAHFPIMISRRETGTGLAAGVQVAR